MFGVDLDTPLTPEALDSALNAIARKIVALRLEMPAVLFLEMHKPLSFLASQTAIFSMPFFAPLLGAQRMADFAKILGEPANVELLILRIEDIAADTESTVAANQE